MTEEKDINVISDEVIAKTLKELSSRYIDRCVSEDFKKSGAEIYSLGVQDGIDVIMKMVTTFESLSLRLEIFVRVKTRQNVKIMIPF